MRLALATTLHAAVAEWESAHVVINPRLFRDTLQLAVPLERAQLSALSDGELDALADRLDTHELHADDAMFAGRRAAEGMSNIIRAVALLSMVPGGVTLRTLGLHWCPDHAECIEAGWTA